MADDSDINTLLDRLGEAQKGSQRMLRRSILLGALALLTLGALDALLVTMGGGRYLMRDLVMVGGLTTLGLVGYWGATLAYRVTVKGDEMLMKEMRRNAELAAEMQRVAPLMAAIDEAHAKGMGLMVMPGDADEDTSAAPTQPPAHHHLN